MPAIRHPFNYTYLRCLGMTQETCIFFKIKTRMIILLLTFAVFLDCASAARILGIFTMAGKSHFACNHAIMKSLHAAGHHITMITPFPSEEKIENFTYVDSRISTDIVHVGQSRIDVTTDMTIYSLLNFCITAEIQSCHDVMKLPKIQEALNSPQKLYDILFFEILLGHECFLPIAEKLGIPVIGTVTVNTIKTADDIVGMPRSPAIAPFAMLTSGSGISFLDHVKNIWYHVLSDYFVVKSRNVIEKFSSEYFAEELLHKKDVSLIFYNNHASLLPRLTPPDVVEIGGIHAQPPKPLPKDLQKFIDEASHGVVLFTFGSVVRGSSISLKKREAFLAAFAAIPQRVLWKFEYPIENLPKNIMLSNWLPQRDILEHRNVIAFISHCGQSGTYEAVMTGTPVIAIPLFADQMANAAILRGHKVAVQVDFESITEERIFDALNTIINDTSYYQRMQALSRVFKDRPMSPQESVVYWTEYVIRNNGSQYLRTVKADIPLYKYFMLEIAAFVLFVMSIATYVTYKGIRKTTNFIFGKPKYATLIKKSE